MMMKNPRCYFFYGPYFRVLEKIRVLVQIFYRIQQQPTAYPSSCRGKNGYRKFLLSDNLVQINTGTNWKFWQSKDEIEMEKIDNGIRNSVLEIIKKREEMMKNGELSDGYGRDYLGLLLNANKDPDELKRISVQDMIDECKTMYFAGHETTASLLTWTCLLLAIHTDWQDEARKEVIELMGKKNKKFDEKCIAKLKIVNMIINESLRLYPPVLGSPRTTASQVRLGKFTLPSDMNVGFSIIAVHHDPKIWGEDVHKFKPDRFWEGIVKATNNNPMATCVGSNFAMIESKIALAMILRSYYFTLSPAYAHSPVERMAMRPQHGLQIILHKLD
ncbi:hypothetical protein MKW92_024544 [Papaver armeniacum]|nr:hypothetical protein MKW92_024544 [Papaver armeniacum]